MCYSNDVIEGHTSRVGVTLASISGGLTAQIQPMDGNASCTRTLPFHLHPPLSLSLSLAAAAGVYLYAIKGKHYFARIILTAWSLATFATPPNQ